jgi:hypothetical protein
VTNDNDFSDDHEYTPDYILYLEGTGVPLIPAFCRGCPCYFHQPGNRLADFADERQMIADAFAACLKTLLYRVGKCTGRVRL